MGSTQDRREVGSHLNGHLLRAVECRKGLEAVGAVASAMVNQLGDDDLALQQRGLIGNRSRLSPQRWEARRQAIFDLAGRLGIGPIVAELYETPYSDEGNDRVLYIPATGDLTDTANIIATLATIDGKDVSVPYKGRLISAYAGELPQSVVNYAHDNGVN